MAAGGGMLGDGSGPPGLGFVIVPGSGATFFTDSMLPRLVLFVLVLGCCVSAVRGGLAPFQPQGGGGGGGEEIGVRVERGG